MFQVRRQPTESIVQLLDKVTLGTDGAHYRHLDTRDKINGADSPLYYSLERHKKAIGNITLCERGRDWYLRYFAFEPALQGAAKKRSKSKTNNRLKIEVKAFFERVFEGEFAESSARSIYAYIDPRNLKSLWMSESFGFVKVRSIMTQSFSRSKPKHSDRLISDLKWEAIADVVKSNYGEYSYYYPVQVKKGPIYGIQNESGELIAFLKITPAKWEISRLPGRMGGLIVKMLPYIPVLNKLIRPANHEFVVPDTVWVKDNDPRILTELFEGVLAKEEKTLMLWWVDEEDELYRSVKDRLKWGIIHKIIGVNEVNLVVLADDKIADELKTRVHFVSGYDFV